MNDLWAALCLVAVFEGLFLFVMPRAWKRAVAQMLEMPDRQVRVIGAIVLGLGVLSLYVVRS